MLDLNKDRYNLTGIVSLYRKIITKQLNLIRELVN
jgi:hypothetical protein